MDTATIKNMLPGFTVFELVDLITAIDDELTAREAEYLDVTVDGETDE